MPKPPATSAEGRWNEDTATFLKFISERAGVRYIFVKDTNSGSHRKLAGYYQSSNFDQLVDDISRFDGNAAGIYYALNHVQEGCLTRAENSLCPASTALSCKTADILRRRLLLVDIDPVRAPDCSASKTEKRHAQQLAQQVHRELRLAGWPKPVVIDSGNGYHLLYRIDLPVNDDGLIRNCLLALAGRYNRDEVKIDTSVHDAVRLAKLPGTMACKGLSSPERPHRRSCFYKLPAEFTAVSHKMLTDLAESYQGNSPTPTTEVRPPSREPSLELVSRARTYLAQMPPAVSGQQGRNQFFNAACRMVDDFALTHKHAMELLKEYNDRCVPPFNDRELLDKLDSALAKVAARGGPSGSALNTHSHQPAQSKPRFLGYVPDFGLVAQQYVCLTTNKRVSLGEMLYRFTLWDRLDSGALVPDIMLRQLIWGAKFDKNWKARLRQKKEFLGPLKPLENNSLCKAGTCSLHGRGFAHHNYLYRLSKYLVLELFRPQNDVDNVHGNRFNLYGDEFKEQREKGQRSGVLFNVYWPAFILGGSRPVGWSWSQQLLVMGMVRELTRTKAKPGQGITGETVKGGMVPATSSASRLVQCPLLDPSRDYVVFAGNGKRKGRGYQIIGRTGKGWLHRSGYVLPEKDPLGKSDKARRECMKPFLTDLSFLSKELGLVPVGVLNGQWKSMGQMMDCLRTGSGQDWLEACTLRIFAPADWRPRWRQYFSDKLGFAWIPETPEDDVVHETKDPSAEIGSVSAHEIREFLKEMKWTQKHLANEIARNTRRPCSVRRVERQLGSSGPNDKFRAAFIAVRDCITADRHSESHSDV